MKIGFILGTFDPPHKGHIDLAIQCIDKNLVDIVYFVPTVQNPWKHAPICTYSKRCDLIFRSIPNDYLNKVGVETIESMLLSPYYSCNTLSVLKEKYCDDELYIIGGADIINNLPKWMNYESMIKGKFKVIGFTRENIEIKDNAIEHILVYSSVPKISSTLIRENIKDKNQIIKYLPYSIIDDCIKLYNKNGNT